MIFRLRGCSERCCEPLRRPSRSRPSYGQHWPSYGQKGPPWEPPGTAEAVGR